MSGHDEAEAPVRSVTERGFDVYDEFTDAYGNTVRVQKSSSATRDCVWVFARHGSPGLRPGYRDRLAAAGFAGQAQIDELAAMLTPSPHLDVEQATRLRDALSVFIAENEEPGR